MDALSRREMLAALAAAPAGFRLSARERDGGLARGLVQADAPSTDPIQRLRDLAIDQDVEPALTFVPPRA